MRPRFRLQRAARHLGILVTLSIVATGIVNAFWTFTLPPFAAVNSSKNEFNLGVQAQCAAISLTNVCRVPSRWGTFGPTWFPGGSPKLPHEWVTRNGSINADIWWRAQVPRFIRTNARNVLGQTDLEANLPIWVVGLLAAIPTAVFIRRESRRKRTNVCRMCDYDLTGNQSGLCPECGTPLARSRRADAFAFCRAVCRTLVLFTSLSICGLMVAFWLVTSFGWLRFYWHGNMRAEVAPAAFVRHDYQLDGSALKEEGLLASVHETRDWLLEGLTAPDLICQLWWYQGATVKIKPLLRLRTLRGMTVTSKHLPFWVIAAPALAPAVLMALMGLRSGRAKRPVEVATETSVSGAQWVAGHTERRRRDQVRPLEHAASHDESDGA